MTISVLIGKGQLHYTFVTCSYRTNRLSVITGIQSVNSHTGLLKKNCFHPNTLIFKLNTYKNRIEVDLNETYLQTNLIKVTLTLDLSN